MAIFGSKKKKEEVKVEEAKTVKSPKAKKATKAETKAVAVAAVPVAISGTASSIASSIIRPRVTEKSGLQSQGGAYTFEVAKSANKNTVKNAVVAMYKVTPIKVNVINVPAKSVFVRGRKGQVSGFRKAIVTLKKGDKIEFV